MLRLTSLALVLATLVSLTSVRAQEFPGLGVGHLWQANMAFDSQMDQMTRNFCDAWLAERTRFRVENNYWGPMQAPFTAADLNRANLETSAAYSGYNASWTANQQSLGNTMNQVSMANRGVWNYGNGHGQYATLPYTTPTYYQDQGGQFWSGGQFGDVPNYHTNFNPYYLMQ